MAERSELGQVPTADGLGEALGLYARFVLGVHERLSVLTTVLAEADADNADLVATADDERFA